MSDGDLEQCGDSEGSNAAVGVSDEILQVDITSCYGSGMLHCHLQHNNSLRQHLIIA